MADHDVIVLGTGAAALTAAVTAAELGANVGLFEKGATIGGTTVYSGGMTYGAAGGTLGPAMVFGFLAGRGIAERVGASTPAALAGA